MGIDYDSMVLVGDTFENISKTKAAKEYIEKMEDTDDGFCLYEALDYDKNSPFYGMSTASTYYDCYTEDQNIGIEIVLNVELNEEGLESLNKQILEAKEKFEKAFGYTPKLFDSPDIT